MESLTIERATLAHVESIIPLFDAYRVFYEQASNPEKAAYFISERLKNSESIIFLAFQGDSPVGFTQLYKTFSSVSLEPFYILNDLFVDANYREQGIAKALLNQAKLHCKKMNYKGLALETAKDNPAQKLYEREGWKLDADYLHYFWSAKA